MLWLIGLLVILFLWVWIGRLLVSRRGWWWSLKLFDRFVWLIVGGLVIWWRCIVVNNWFFRGVYLPRVFLPLTIILLVLVIFFIISIVTLSRPLRFNRSIELSNSTSVSMNLVLRWRLVLEHWILATHFKVLRFMDLASVGMWNILAFHNWRLLTLHIRSLVFQCLASLLLGQCLELLHQLVQIGLHHTIVSFLCLHELVQCATDSIHFHRCGIWILPILFFCCHHHENNELVQDTPSPITSLHGSTATKIQVLAPEFYTRISLATLAKSRSMPSPPQV